MTDAPPPRRPRHAAPGFSLVETMVAVTLLAGAVIALAELLAMATRGNLTARTATRAALLAEQKMEQLKALEWVFDENGRPVSDTATNVAGFAPAEGCAGSIAGAAVGLSPSPLDALLVSSDGYVDYVDALGCGLGGGLTPPPGTVYIRRWSIAPVVGAADTLVLQVLVTDHGVRAPAGPGASGARKPGEAWLVGMKSRKSP